jgi:hypothetical protein
MFERATKEKPVMWGDAIVGFGNEPVVYANGTSMDWPLMAFSPRAQDIVLYSLRSADDFAKRLAAIAPAKLKGGCVHIKRLADVDAQALESLIVAAVKGRQAKAKAATAKVAAKPAVKKVAVKKAPAKKAPAKKAPAKKAAVKKAPVKKRT